MGVVRQVLRAEAGNAPMAYPEWFSVFMIGSLLPAYVVGYRSSGRRRVPRGGYDGFRDAAGRRSLRASGGAYLP